MLGSIVLPAIVGCAASVGSLLILLSALRRQAAAPRSTDVVDAVEQRLGGLSLSCHASCLSQEQFCALQATEEWLAKGAEQPDPERVLLALLTAHRWGKPIDWSAMESVAASPQHLESIRAAIALGEAAPGLPTAETEERWRCLAGEFGQHLRHRAIELANARDKEDVTVVVSDIDEANRQLRAAPGHWGPYHRPYAILTGVSLTLGTALLVLGTQALSGGSNQSLAIGGAMLAFGAVLFSIGGLLMAGLSA